MTTRRKRRVTLEKARREQHDRPLEERVAYYRAQNKTLSAQNNELRRQIRALHRLRERAEDLVNTANLFLEEIAATNPRPINPEPENTAQHSVYVPVADQPDEHEVRL
jgi:predicted RNase H-like nuclease (RuvC/YqgF family)